MKLLSLSFLLFLTLSSEVQQRWTPEMYNTVNYKNFRSNELFNQAVDYENLDYPMLNACLFFLCNEQRAKRHLQPLEYSPVLEKEASMHSTDMGEKHFFSHINKDIKTKKDPDVRAKLVGIINPHIIENIAKNSGGGKTYLVLATVFHNQWTASESHKKNMFSNIALELGCGTFYKDNQWYATQCFQCYEKIMTTHHLENKLDMPKK